MSEQLLESEPLLPRVFATVQQLRVGVGRRAMQAAQCLGKRRQSKLVADRPGQQLPRWRRLHSFQRLAGQVAQAALLDALGCGIDRRQHVVHRGIFRVAQDAVLRVNHFETGAAGAHLPETADVSACLELGVLLPGEMKKTQRELAAAVCDSNQQVAAPAVRRFRQQDFTADQAALPGLQGTDANELGAVLVAQRQEEQQVLDAVQVEPLQLPGKGRPDPGEIS